MALLVDLKWGEKQLSLGAHEEIILGFDEIRAAGGDGLLARHRHNRWIAEQNGEQYPTLEVVGPLIIVSHTGAQAPLGPYQNLSTFDGVAYVEGRVFAFTDLQTRDWYVHDRGVHWPSMKVVFHRTGP
jgi:hypothetical protein